MDINFPKNLKDFKYHLKDPLYKNSAYILLALVIGAISGFIFWIIAARVYPQDVVGVNTTLISVVTLIAILSFLGLDQSIVRFFPDGNKLNIIITSSIVIIFSTIILGIIFILGISIWSPKLGFLKDNLLLFFISIIAFSLTSPLGQAFIASRKSKYYFYQYILMGLRVIIVLLPFWGNLGIFISFSISSLIATTISLYFVFILKNQEFKLKNFKIDTKFLKDSFHFSAANYFIGILVILPGYILPIMVFNLLGGEQTANYYISYSFAYLLFMIPSAFSTSLFVEGSHGESLGKNTLKTIFAVFLLLLPIAFLMYVFGGYFLGLLGKSYLSGLELLRALIISSFFVSIFYIYISIKKVQKNIVELILASSLIFILLLGLSYVLMLQFGIVGVGYAWIISYLAGSIFVFIKLRKYW
ncbi:MAG: oligosaccharide flippase family protein [Methanobacteriaceae archaeon]|nr:oligosaccharide flippase family protein [Methanobacteriaceae archaeon]